LLAKGVRSGAVCLRRLRVACFVATLLAAAPGAEAQSSFALFESGPVRPLALSPDGTKLFVCNIPDGRLEIFSVTASGLSYDGSAPVGLEPVAVAARSNSEVWVVNHLSDSVSVVDVPSRQVKRTLLVGDEPRDIVFGGPERGRAFISAAHRGQNRPGDPQLSTPGVGRADVWVFDAANLGAALGGSPLAVLSLFGDTPRALAVTPDGGTVYVAIFESGNQTTAVPAGVLPTLPPTPTMTDPADGSALPTPQTAVMLQYQAGTTWLDANGGAHTDVVQFQLPDLDVFALDANANPPAETASYAHVGTVLYNMAVNPVSGAVYVSNTDANNMDRFEGFGSPNLRGEIHRSRITIIAGGSAAPRRLNTQINYAALVPGQAVNDASLGQPTALVVTGDGAKLYVAAFGSGEVGVVDTAALALPPGSPGAFAANKNDHIALTKGGPAGLALDDTNHRLYVYTRFDDGISIVDTVAKSEVAHVALHDPEPASVVNGRRFLYDTKLSSGNGEASCGVCHVYGDFDSLAWDLGAPDVGVVPNTNPFVSFTIPNDPTVYGFVQGNPDWHPLKGPMTTQSLRGMRHGGPMHWRGDRTGGLSSSRAPTWSGDPVNALDASKAFLKFNNAFVTLLGRSSPLAQAQIQAFADYVLQLQMPPNPLRNLDNSLTPAQQAGSDFFHGPLSDGVKSCAGCHTVDGASGSFGTAGLSSAKSESQHFKVPQLRNVYQKLGMFGMPATGLLPATGNPSAPQVRGFGLMHDGAADTLFDFLQGPMFMFPNGDTDRANVSDFVLAMASDLAPIVGQQVTLDAASAADPAVNARIDLLVQRAGTPYASADYPGGNECDLIVKSSARGWLMTAPGVFTPDVDGGAVISDVDLRALATSLPGELTYSCVPPGSGTRMGIDRGGIGLGSAPDGIRDGSQCGDVNQDGLVTPPDVDGVRALLAGAPTSALRARCNVDGAPGSADETCDIVDLARLRRALANLGPGLGAGCNG
jgi:YVTN family beta-propeller protein